MARYPDSVLKRPRQGAMQQRLMMPTEEMIQCSAGNTHASDLGNMQEADVPDYVKGKRTIDG
jgi:hypothetical protein